MINQKKCEFEQTIVKSVKSGFLREETKQHADACADCRETLKVVSWLNMSAKSAAPPSPENLPAAGFLWWKSRILEKRRRAELVSQPIQIAQILAAAISIGTFLWLAISGSPQIDSLDAAFNRIFALTAAIAVPLTAGIIGFSILCGTLILVLRRFMPEK